MLPMTPNKPRDSRHQYHPNRGIELVKVFSQFAPVLAQLHSEISQAEAPRPRSQKRVEMKASAGHASHSGRQCDESANHGQQPTKKYRQQSPPAQKLFGHLNSTLSHHNPP